MRRARGCPPETSEGKREGVKVSCIVYYLMSLIVYVKTSGCVGIIHAYIATHSLI